LLFSRFSPFLIAIFLIRRPYDLLLGIVIACCYLPSGFLAYEVTEDGSPLYTVLEPCSFLQFICCLFTVH
jgi:hypothetical protein